MQRLELNHQGQEHLDSSGGAKKRSSNIFILVFVLQTFFNIFFLQVVMILVSHLIHYMKVIVGKL